LSGLSYIASAGVGVLIGAQHIAKKHGGGLGLVNPSPSVREIFSILGLDAILPIHDNMDDAMAELRVPPAALPAEA
jgi:anti-sigma B factor antagonist